jgi:hypothetical protein
VRTAHTVAAVALAVGLALAVAPAERPARAEDPFGGLRPTYWPQRAFGIPLDRATFNALDPKPTHLQLYYSLNRGAFQKGTELAVGALQPIAEGKEGFLFDAPRDGDYEFAVQLVYGDGTVSPKENQLAGERRAIIDTVPPRVQIAAVGNGVEWSASDDNLDAREMKLECKWPTSSEWTQVKDREFRARDNYAWRMPPGKVLEVRVRARDLAGNDGISPIVRVPGDTGATVGLPKGGAGGSGGFGAPGLPQPRIGYVKQLDFHVDYTVQKMGRSGVQAAHLFVLREQGGWELVKRHPVELLPDDKSHALSVPYKAEREGTFGFYVIPESGAGKRDDDPKRDDPPMVLVVVDTTKPKVQLTGVQVKPGGAKGPVVEFTWEASDPNLMPQPVRLEWSLDKSAAVWTEVKSQLDNNLTATSGRYAWEVPDEKVWKFWVRMSALDKAGNVGEHVWPQEVLVDLVKPSATIDRVRGSPATAPPDKLP